MPNSSSFFLPEKNHEDPNYKIIRDSTKPGDIEWKRHIEERWKVFQPYVNAQFREKAQEDIFPFWWEMFLGAKLLENEFNLDRVGVEEPDICINYDDKRVWVEATMPKKGGGQDRVPDLLSYKENCGQAVYLPTAQIILRYTNAISSKNNQRENRLNSGVCAPTDPYIIAIHSYFLNDFSSAGIQNIVKAVYPVGNLFVDFSRESEGTQGQYSYRDVISKGNDTEISTSVFLNEASDEYKGISGILFARCHPGRLTNLRESDFIFIHNFLANNPLPFGIFNFAQEFYIEETEDNFELKVFGR